MLLGTAGAEGLWAMEVKRRLAFPGPFTKSSAKKYKALSIVLPEYNFLKLQWNYVIILTNAA